MKHSLMAGLVHFPYFRPAKREKIVAALVCCGGPKWCLFAASHPSIACRSSSPYTLAGNHPSITLGYAEERLASVHDMNFFLKKGEGGTMGLPS